MNLKKILTTAVVLGIFSGTASALEIGDKMPGLFNRGITKNFMTETVIINYHPYQDKNGEIINPEDYEYATSISYSKECLEKRGMKPFAVLSFKENRIHVDEDADGVIDGRVGNEKSASEELYDTFIGMYFTCNPDRLRLPLLLKKFPKPSA